MVLKATLRKSDTEPAMVSGLLRPSIVFPAATLLRLGLFVYGLWQDAHSHLKYTDIDYYVFTDAAQCVAMGHSPYDRATYRYTPLLAWILWPTTLAPASFSLGKLLFAAGDIVAGWLIFRILCRHHHLAPRPALAVASLWLLNPMVAIISTRGSAEGLVCALVIALLWAVLQRRIVLAACLLALAVHLKLYPLIYAPSIVWSLHTNTLSGPKPSWPRRIRNFCNPARLTLAVVATTVFFALNLLMYYIYGQPFLKHTYLHHVTRIDHRHNFSPYNIVLYLSSATPTPSHLRLESLSFLPQIFLSLVAIPFTLAKRDLASTMFAQSFAFVSFNKVCTSQYFLWYIVLLPFYLPNSSFLNRKRLGALTAILWASTQAAWLHQAYKLEFFGVSTFVPGLWLASLSFFMVNSCILGIIVLDVGTKSHV